MTLHTNHSSPISPDAPLWIVGPGAVGLTIAATLASSRPISVLVRPGSPLQANPSAIGLAGARDVQVPLGQIRFVSATHLAHTDELREIWLAVKANDIVRATKELLPFLPSGATVVALSNGIGIGADLQRMLPSGIALVRVLPSFGAYRTDAATVRLAGDLLFTLAAAEHDRGAAERIGATLRSIGAQVSEEPSVELAEWRKAAVNLIVNPLCALAAVPNGALATDRRLREMVEPLVGEINAVVEAAGIPLPILQSDTILERLAPHASNLNSMLVDLHHGRPTEIDYITGRFIEAAERFGVPTPLSRSIYNSVKLRESEALGKPSTIRAA